jgi:hypothetical protein
MWLESLLGAGWRSIVVGESKVGGLGQNRVSANSHTSYGIGISVEPTIT